MLLVLLVVTGVSCTSPEATRTQGGGPGADTGNRGDAVLMHEGSKPYENTPKRIPAAASSIDSANHAHRLSQ